MFVIKQQGLQEHISKPELLMNYLINQIHTPSLR